MSLPVIPAFILAYLIGAIPSSVWLGKIFYGKDVREFGSRNAGATNTFRVLGATAGIIVLALDVLKGIAAVMLGFLVCPSHIFDCPLFYYQLAFGLTAALGHIFPIYLRFKGGKGVATFFGVILYLFPIAALICVITFFLVFIITHYVSLSSIISSVAFSITILILHLQETYGIPIMIFTLIIPIIIFYTHRKNISRLMNGTETKMYFSKKENQS